MHLAGSSFIEMVHCLFVPKYSDRWSGKCRKLSVRTDIQGTMVSAGWVVNTGDAFGLMKLENTK